MVALRRCIRQQNKLEISYASLSGTPTRRIVWPMSLVFFPPVWLLLGWCELRCDVRSFRVDRIGDISFMDKRYPQQPGGRLVGFPARNSQAV